MEVDKDSLLSYLIYNREIQYDKHITLSPVTMKDYLFFNMVSKSITVRKNSTFRSKKIIKMTYLEFLLYSYNNKELENDYDIDNLSNYYEYALHLLRLCCKNAEIIVNSVTGDIYINGELITPHIFDDLRRIIIIQNDIDFDIDEFIHHDTEKRLLEAKKSIEKDTANIEDYIDSLVVGLHLTEEDVMNMTVRKFWRYIKRFNLHEQYTICKTGEASGWSKLKEPLKHWMSSIEEEDKYKDLKTDENELRGKIG